MTYTLVNVKVIDQASSWNNKKVDVILSKGRIVKIGKGLKRKGTLVEGKGLHLSPGWIDMKVHFCDPGHEYKEDLRSGLAAAKVGGFTSVVTMPDTEPAVDNKGAVEYLLTRSQNSGVRVYPAASISKRNEGKELSEMVDLSISGVKIFTDDKRPISNSSLMSRALLYAKDTNGTVCSFPQDPLISEHGKMNEGVVSTSLGVTGVPHTAETIMLKRDIDLLRYTESRMHVSGLTTAESVKLIKEAKKEGLDITSEVHLANLIWTDEKLKSYDTNYKLSPPLRTEKDRRALIRGVNDGTIDCISSDHRPEDVEHKKLEFGLANNGIALIESFFPLYYSYLSTDIEIGIFVKALTQNPCKILGLTSAIIEEGKPAILTLFSTAEKPSPAPIKTKAYNTPCIHEEVKGKVLMTYI